MRRDHGVAHPSPSAAPTSAASTALGHERSVADVDAWVTGLVVERLSRPDAVDLLVASERADLAKLRDQASALRARQDELVMLMTDPNIPVTKVRTAAADIAAQLAEVEAKMLDANKPASSTD